MPIVPFLIELSMLHICGFIICAYPVRTYSHVTYRELEAGAGCWVQLCGLSFFCHGRGFTPISWKCMFFLFALQME